MKLVDWQCDVCGVKAKIPEGSDPPIHNCKPRGLGDLVAKGLKKVGITKERTTRVKQILTGNDYAECGCKGRQDWLNSLWTFNEKEDDNTDIEMPYYWLEDEARLSRDAICQNIRMWSHPSEDTEAVITSPMFFAESRFFGYKPELSYRTVYDIDGIFLADIFPNDQLKDAAYEQVLYAEQAMNVVLGHEVNLLTGRYEKYRKVTEDWFAANRMEIFKMTMYQGGEFEHERHAMYKADAYANMSALVMVESDIHQARHIYNATLKTVICPEHKRVLTNREQLRLLSEELSTVDNEVD